MFTKAISWTATVTKLKNLLSKFNNLQLKNLPTSRRLVENTQVSHVLEIKKKGKNVLTALKYFTSYC